MLTAFINTVYRNYLFIAVLSWMLLAVPTSAQFNQQAIDQVESEPVIEVDWQVEVIVFIHLQPDEAFRDRADLDDYRDLPALPALLTAAEPLPPPPPAEPLFPRLDETENLTEPFFSETFATEVMANAWQQITDSYQRVGYFHWQQTEGQGSLRRLHDDQPLSADDSLSLGPHFEFDGQIRVTTDTIGYLNLQLTHRTPLLLTSTFPEQSDSNTSRLWRTLKLDQQRRIQPERIEYFDSAGLGLLILISSPESFQDMPLETP